MRRLLAALIALSLASLQMHALAFHVHASVEYDGDHHHGPEIHHHVRNNDPIDGAPHIDAPDPSETAVTMAVPASATMAARPLIAEWIETALPLAIVLNRSNLVRLLDIRQHSPPSLLISSLRGPPSSVSA